MSLAIHIQAIFAACPCVSTFRIVNQVLCF